MFNFLFKILKIRIALLISFFLCLGLVGNSSYAQSITLDTVNVLHNNAILTRASIPTISVCAKGNSFYYDGVWYSCTFNSISGESQNLRKFNVSSENIPEGIVFFATASGVVVPQSLLTLDNASHTFFEKINISAQSLADSESVQSVPADESLSEFNFIASLLLFLVVLLSFAFLLSWQLPKFENFLNLRQLLLATFGFILFLTTRNEFSEIFNRVTMQLAHTTIFLYLLTLFLLFLSLLLYYFFSLRISTTESSHKMLTAVFLISFISLAVSIVIRISITNTLLPFFVLLFTSTIIVKNRISISTYSLVSAFCIFFALLVLGLSPVFNKRVILKNVELFDGLDEVLLPVEVKYDKKYRFYSTDYKSTSPIFINRYSIYYPNMTIIQNYKNMEYFRPGQSLNVINNEPGLVFSESIKNDALRSLLFTSNKNGNAFYVNVSSPINFLINCDSKPLQISLFIYDASGLIKEVDFSKQACLYKNPIEYVFNKQDYSDDAVIVYFQHDASTNMRISADTDSYVPSYLYNPNDRILYEKINQNELYVVNFEERPFTISLNSLDIANALNKMLDQAILSEQGIAQIWSSRSWHTLQAQ